MELLVFFSRPVLVCGVDEAGVEIDSLFEVKSYISHSRAKGEEKML